MASLVRRKSGSANVWYVVYTDVNGKQRWVKGYTDKSESARLANRLEDEKTKLIRGEVDPKVEARRTERARPIEEHIRGFENALRAKGNRPNHIAYTVADIRRFATFSGVIQAEAIVRTQVDEWVISLQCEQTKSLKRGKVRTKTFKLAPRTVNRHIKSLQSFLKFWYRQGILTEYVLYGYPQLKTKGHERRVRRALSPAEQSALIGAADATRVAVYQFALLTGARLGQIRALTVKDVNLGANTVSLQAKDAGHGDKEHIVPLHEALLASLKERCAGRGLNDLIFPDAPSKDNAADWIRQDCRKSGIDTTHVDFHALRHTFGSTLAARGVHPKVLQALMGHSDIETTLGYYTHFRREDEREAVTRLLL